MNKGIFAIGFAAACAMGVWDAAHAQDVTFSSWGGAYQEAQRTAMLDKAEEKQGIKIGEDSHTGLAAIKTQVLSGQVNWDIVDLSTPDCERGRKDELWQELDYGLIPNAAALDAEYRNPYWVGFITYSTVLAWNTETVANPPQNWAEFWDVEKFPGKRSLRNRARDMLEVALLADGVPRDELYPIDVERAYAKLEEIRPHVDVWWTSGGQTAQMAIDNEVDMMLVWNGRIQAAMDEGATWDYHFIDGNIAVECLVVPRGAGDPETAMKVINEMLDAANQAEFTQYIPYGPVNDAAYDEGIDPQRAAMLPSHPDNMATQFVMNPDWWSSPEGEAAEARWTSFLQQ
jgi:putative spermidine/putrescine transport system substrate-binding protein